MCSCQPQQILLVLSIHATYFGHTDHTQAFKYMILELQMQRVYILNFCYLTNCKSHNNLYVAIKI